MPEFLKKHKILSAIASLFIIVILYYGFVMIKAYQETPTIIARVSSSGRMALKIEDFPTGYIDILLNVEDPGFYTHHGIDLVTPGAGYTTITQSLVKQLYFDKFKPGISKIKQSLIALVLDKRVDKKTQLSIFVNTVYMGTVNGAEVRGLDEASHAYFGKNVPDLTKDEYLSLVAMIIGPDGFNVANHRDKNLERVRRINRLLNNECKPNGNSDVYLDGCR